ASAADDDVSAAVVSVGQALIQLEDSGVVVAASKDPSTVPFARERLEALVAAMPTPPPTEPGGKKKK
ncbi:MAG TPA: hypothetical protein VII82_02110, partial [Polyangiaceae bacterium]